MAATKVIRNALLTVEASDFAATVRKARLVPEVNMQTYRTLVPSGAVTDVDSPVWTLELEGLQDHASGGLAKLLHDNHGAEIDVVLAPVNASGAPQASVTVVGQSVPFGGTTGEWADFDITLGVVGQPTFGTVPSE